MRGVRFIFAVVVALGMLLMAGCGGSSTSTVSPATQKQVDFRLAQALVPQGYDLGAGWTPEPFIEHDGCAGSVPRTGLVPTAHVGGVAFQHGDHPALIAAANVYRTEAQARTAYRLAVRYHARCVARVLSRTARRSEATGRHVTAVRFTRFGLPAFGDQSRAYRQVIVWNISGLSMSNDMALVYFRVGRGVGAMIGLNENAPFDPKLLTRLTSAIADRGQSAQGAA